MLDDGAHTHHPEQCQEVGCLDASKDAANYRPERRGFGLGLGGPNTNGSLEGVGLALSGMSIFDAWLLSFESL
ncbi:MAG: hypothetical protein ACO3NR_10820, partial [Rhodothermales bacterium]